MMNIDNEDFEIFMFKNSISKPFPKAKHFSRIFCISKYIFSACKLYNLYIKH